MPVLFIEPQCCFEHSEIGVGETFSCLAAVLADFRFFQRAPDPRVHILSFETRKNEDEARETSTNLSDDRGCTQGKNARGSSFHAYLYKGRTVLSLILCWCYCHTLPAARGRPTPPGRTTGVSEPVMK